MTKLLVIAQEELQWLLACADYASLRVATINPTEGARFKACVQEIRSRTK